MIFLLVLGLFAKLSVVTVVAALVVDYEIRVSQQVDSLNLYQRRMSDTKM